MNLKSWTKTILLSYRHLPKIVKSIDKIFNTRAINAGVMSGASITYNNVYNVTENLIILTERKVNLINLKLLCDKIIMSLDKNLAKVLILRYMDNLSYDKIAQVLKMSSRTVYRKVKQALEEGANILKNCGYNEYKLENKFKNEKWLYEIEQDITKKDGMVIDDLYINSICKRYNNLATSQIVAQF